VGFGDKLLRKELAELFDGGYDLRITGFTLADMTLDNVPPPLERVQLPPPT